MVILEMVLWNHFHGFPTNFRIVYCVDRWCSESENEFTLSRHKQEDQPKDFFVHVG